MMLVALAFLAAGLASMVAAARVSPGPLPPRTLYHTMRQWVTIPLASLGVGAFGLGLIALVGGPA